MITLVGRDDFGKEIRFTLSQIKSLGWSKRSMCIQADEYECIDPETVECANCAGLRELLSDYEKAARSRDALVRQLDVIWNGEAGAAKQASLCDIVSQMEVEVPELREQIKVLREALGSYAECCDGCTCGDGWSHDIANAALDQTKSKDGE